MSLELDTYLQPYKCIFCSGYHVGHPAWTKTTKKKKRKSKPRADRAAWIKAYNQQKKGERG